MPDPYIVSIERSRSLIQILKLKHIASRFNRYEQNREESSYRKRSGKKRDIPILDNKLEVVFKVLILWLQQLLVLLFSNG